MRFRNNLLQQPIYLKMIGTIELAVLEELEKRMAILLMEEGFMGGCTPPLYDLF